MMAGNGAELDSDLTKLASDLRDANNKGGYDSMPAGAEGIRLLRMITYASRRKYIIGAMVTEFQEIQKQEISIQVKLKFPEDPPADLRIRRSWVQDPNFPPDLRTAPNGW